MPKRRTNGRNVCRAHHGAAIAAAAHKRMLPTGGLPAREARDSRAGGGDRVRSGSLRPAWRCSTIATARSATSSRRSASRSGDTVMSGPQADILPGNALPIRNIPLGTLVHNVELQPGRGAPDLPERGRAGSSCWPRKGDRADAQAALRRSAARCPSSAWPPWARSAISTTRTSPSARPGACAGRGSARPCAGTVMNPVDHPDGRRRGQGQGQPSDDAVGQADQGLQDPARRAPVRPLHRDAPEEVGAARWDAR